MLTRTKAKAASAKNPTASELLRAGKLESYRLLLAQAEEKCVALEKRQDELKNVNVIGLTVIHKVFGVGTVTEQNDATISVAFSFGSKRFLMPSAFIQGFLKAEDTAMDNVVFQLNDLAKQIKAVQDSISAVNASIKVLESK